MKLYVFVVFDWKTHHSPNKKHFSKQKHIFMICVDFNANDIWLISSSFYSKRLHFSATCKGDVIEEQWRVPAIKKSRMFEIRKIEKRKKNKLGSSIVFLNRFDAFSDIWGIFFFFFWNIAAYNHHWAMPSSVFNFNIEFVGGGCFTNLKVMSLTHKYRKWSIFMHIEWFFCSTHNVLCILIPIWLY